MSDHAEHEDLNALILAAEDCAPEQFEQLHSFSAYEERILRSLIAHGPVLLRGGRGSGKSALLIEASRRLAHHDHAIGLYVTLRHLPLLRSEGAEYERIFCKLVSEHTQHQLTQAGLVDGPPPYCGDTGALREWLRNLAMRYQRRIVLIFDDAAHIGRETALTEFFDIFRMLSCDLVACKAAIYPGVTKFGVRFDVFNDATVLDLARDERSAAFKDFFEDVLVKRYPRLADRLTSQKGLTRSDIAGFLGRTVVGNMRAFIFACRWLEPEQPLGLTELRAVLIKLAEDYYWPLLDEIEPKLGPYAPLIDPARQVAETLFEFAGQKTPPPPSVVVHRELVQRLAKVLEILEYAGFLSRREVSRALKSGGRGPRYSLNLALLLEQSRNAQLTHDLMAVWLNPQSDYAEIHVKGEQLQITLPALDPHQALGILSAPLVILCKSKAYPYGLTPQKYESLLGAALDTVGKLADAEDDEIVSIEGIGDKTLSRIRNIVGQAIWM